MASNALHRIAHENDDCSFLICFIDCVLGRIEGILEYLNKWAYVYVGLYGYSYLDAGRNVMALFQHKGWTTLMTSFLELDTTMLAWLGLCKCRDQIAVLGIR
jgi:Plasma-membrane choline transporter